MIRGRPAYIAVVSGQRTKRRLYAREPEDLVRSTGPLGRGQHLGARMGGVRDSRLISDERGRMVSALGNAITSVLEHRCGPAMRLLRV
jgi:hypothetical protein